MKIQKKSIQPCNICNLPVIKFQTNESEQGNNPTQVGNIPRKKCTSRSVMSQNESELRPANSVRRVKHCAVPLNAKYRVEKKKSTSC